MAAVNKVFLLGNVGKKIDLRSTQEGIPVANFSLATNEVYFNKNKEKQEKTEWHNIVCFGKIADVVGKYCTPGKQIHIEGSLTSSDWTDKDGNKRRTTNIRATNIILLGSRNDKNQAGQSQGAPNTKQPANDVEEDDIPF